MIDTRIDALAPGAVVIEPREVLDAAVLGVTLDGRVIYDGYLMVKLTVEADNMDEQDALEWLQHNVWQTEYGNYPGPVFQNTVPSLWSYEEEDEE